MRQNRRPTKSDRKRPSLQDSARDTALDAAAATLAAIHLAKQVRAEARSQATDSFRPGLLDMDLRLPLGDVLFGVAQLQIDFARKLFMLNRQASKRLLHQLRKGRRPSTSPIRIDSVEGAVASSSFTIRNSASLARTLTITGKLPGSDWTVSLKHGNADSGANRPLQVTIAADHGANITAEFKGLLIGFHEGFIEVRSHGVLVEQIPLDIEVHASSGAASRQGAR